MIKVSVIIPIYNTEKYIEKCAISLFEQTLDNIEFIFISDCSPDKSVEILKDVLLRYPNRIHQTRIIEMPENKGVAAVRQYGISIAKGEYVANCDSDDWVNVDMYRTLYEFAHSKSYDIVRCKFVRCSSKGAKECYTIPSICYKNKQKYISYLLRESDLNSLCDKLIKKSLFDDNKITYPYYHMYEDNVLNIQLAYYSTSIGYVDKVLYYYYLNPQSITHAKSSEKIVDKMRQKKCNVDIIVYFLESKGLRESYTDEIATLQYNVREEIQSIIYRKGMFKLWNSIYPDLSVKSLKSNTLKVKYILNRLRLSYIINLYRKFCKIITITKDIH